MTGAPGSRTRRAAREIDWSAMIEKEPITVILSQRGWIRAMKGHLALDQVGDLKWREGDGPFIHFHAQTTDRLALFASNGRVYTLAGRQAAERARVRRAGAAVHRPRRRGRHRPAARYAARDEAADRLIGRQGLRHQRRSDARRDPQGQAARQRPRRRQGRGRPADPRRRRCCRGRRREPQDAGVPARRAARAWRADRASPCNATATAAFPTPSPFRSARA